MNDSDYPIRAYVSRDYRMYGGCSIWLRHRDRGILRPDTTDGSAGNTWERIDEHGATQIAPSLVLDDEMAHALLDALAVYFGGTGEVQTLRRDYEAERKRVDKMIDHLLTEQRGIA